MATSTTETSARPSKDEVGRLRQALDEVRTAKTVREAQRIAYKALIIPSPDETNAAPADTYPHPMAWLGFPAGPTPKYDLVYSGTTRLPGYIYKPIYTPENHPSAVRDALKAFVQLCAPHGKDWLTCPECAKDAVNGASNVAR